MTATISWSVLRDTSASIGTQPIDMQRRCRLVLVILLLNANRPVSTDRIADALWGEVLPKTWRNSLSRFVVDLRRALGDFGSRVEAREGGYRIVVHDGELDLDVVRQALTGAAHGDHGESIDDVTTQALQHAWHLVGIQPNTVLDELYEYEGVSRSHSETRAALIDALAAALWQKGDVSQLVALLEQAVDRYPYNESFWFQLMRALDQNGRSVEAAAAADRLRSVMREVGATPSAAHLELEAAIRRRLGDSPTSRGSASTPTAANDARASISNIEIAELIANGQGDYAVSLLQQHIDEYPDDDDAVALLMVALAGHGRRRQALTVFADASDRWHGTNRTAPPLLQELELRILVDDPAMQSEELAATIASGKESGLPAFIPAPPIPNSLRRVTPPVGRADDSNLSALLATPSSRPHTVFVAGEAGIGKTTLLSSAAAGISERGCWTFYGGCDPEVDDSLQPFREIAAALIARLPHDMLRQHVAEHGGELQRFGAGLASRVDCPAPMAGDPTQERAAFFDAIAGLMNSAGQRFDAVFMIDDLHWAGAASIDLVVHVSRRLNHGVLLLSYRHTQPDQTDELRNTLALLERRGAIRLEPLAPLSGPELGGLATSLLGDHVEPAELERLTNQVALETAGHPLYASHLLGHLASSEVADHTLPSPRVPASLRELIWQKAAALGGPLVQVLETASVLGSPFATKTLVELVDIDMAQCVAAIDLAVQARLLVPSTQHAELAFTHAVVQHSCYEQMGPARRVMLHDLAADAIAASLEHKNLDLETLDPIDMRAIAAVARHRALGYQPERAWEWEERAGHLAAQLLDPREASRWFGLAIGHCRSANVGSQTVVRLLVAHGQALHLSGDPSAREQLLEAAELAQDVGDDSSLVQAALINSRGFQLAYDGQRIATLEAALATRPSDPATRAVLKGLLAIELHSSRRWAEVDSLVDGALNDAERSDNPAVTARVAALAINALWRPGQLARRQQLAQTVHQTLHSLPSAAERFRAYWAMHGVSVERGDAETARQHLRAMNELAEQSTSRQTDWPMSIVATFWRTMEGDLASAEELAQASWRISQELGEADALQIFAAQFMVVRSYGGGLLDLFPLVEGAANTPGASHGVRAAYAIMCARSGDPDKIGLAREILHAGAASQFDDVQPNFMWVTTIMAYTVLAEALDDHEVAATIYPLLQPLRTEVAFSGMTSQGSVALRLGQLALLLGRLDDAAEHLHESLTIHRRLGWPVYVAHSAYMLAKLELARSGRFDEPAMTLLNEAEALCHVHGFGPLGDAVAELRKARQAQRLP